MNCPKCSKETIVKDSRKKDKSVIRRRLCECGERFTTKEIVITLQKGNYQRTPVKALSMTKAINGEWTVKVDENTPEWAKKMLINL
jgi:transcriptional regulator NrdR family protein